MEQDNHLLDTLARRVAGRLSPEALRRLVDAGLGESTWTQRKTLTLLFVGAAGLGDPRESQRFEGQLEWLAARHHGIRDRFAPHGALVFFERAANSVAMALALQREAQPFRLRMGITTASCRLASFCCDGDAYVTLLGAEASLAQQVAEAATTGSILISPSTYALVRDTVHADARDCLLAEEFDAVEGATATIVPTPVRGGADASTFAGLGTF